MCLNESERTDVFCTKTNANKILTREKLLGRGREHILKLKNENRTTFKEYERAMTYFKQKSMQKTVDSGKAVKGAQSSFG